MSNETTTTLAGNLTADPELRRTFSGVPVATFTVASTAQVLDGASGEWRDGETLFLRCVVWRRAAESVAAHLGKGARVLANGRLRQNTFVTEDGQRRSNIELVADEVALSLRSDGITHGTKESRDVANPVRAAAAKTEKVGAS